MKGYKLWLTMPIGADDVRVWKVKGFLEKTGLYGDCRPWMKSIRVDSDLDHDTASHTLIHEWFHYYREVSGKASEDERAEEDEARFFDQLFWRSFRKYMKLPK